LGLLNALTSTPYALVTGAEDGLGGGVAEGEAGETAGELVRDELAAGGRELTLPGMLQAPASARISTPSAEARSRVLIHKGNATIRIGLRFRYHPAPEAGSPTLTPRASLEGVAVGG
jgi:hypothetical protein